MSLFLGFGKWGRACACLIAAGVLVGFSASQAHASKAVSTLPFVPSLDRNVRTPSNGHNPNLVYVNVGKGVIVYDAKKKIYEMEFLVTMSQPKHTAVTVNIATKNSSAVSGVNYKGESGSITFKPLQTSYTVYVPIILQPKAVKSSSSFYLVTKSASGNVQLGDGEATGTIPPPDAGGKP